MNDIVIVGAPRSGTNMLRDVLRSLPGVTTWPCDEINLIWRHGNRAAPSDELSIEDARPEVRTYVRRRFDALRRAKSEPVVVEKTCATSLRLGFTRAILPDARYVFIARDGIDATASAMLRWYAPFDWRYTARKVRWMPPSDAPYYGWRFANTAWARKREAAQAANNPRSVNTWWGPKPHDFRELMSRHPLDEICAIQWQRCVESSLQGFEGLGQDQLLAVSYEDFVANPVAQAERLRDFLGLRGDVRQSVANVSAGSVGKGRRQLGEEAAQRIEALVGPTLERVRAG